jgi:hypothetical protein
MTSQGIRLLTETVRPHHERDPVAFAGSIGFDADPWQARVLRSQSKRIILNCSRQVGKSTITALMAQNSFGRYGTPGTCCSTTGRRAASGMSAPTLSRTTCSRSSFRIVAG